MFLSLVPPLSPPSPLAVQSRLFHLLKGFSWTNNEYSVQVVDLCLGAVACKVFKVHSSVRAAVEDSHHYLRRISIESIPQRVLVLVSVVAENQWHFSRVSPLDRTGQDRTGRTLTKLALAQRLESLSATNDIFIKKKNCPLAHSPLLNCCRVETLERTDMRDRERERGTFTRSFTSLWAEFRAAIRSMKSFEGGGGGLGITQVVEKSRRKRPVGFIMII